MREELQTRAAEAVELAKSAGAQDAWASAGRDREVEFSVRDGKLEKVQESTSRSLSLRLWVDGRYSTHSTTDLRPDRLKGFVDEAVALTRALQPDPHRVIPEPALFEGRAEVDLDLVDPAQQAITREQRIAWCMAQNEQLVGKDKVISATSGTSDSHGVSAMASSNGFSGAHEVTSVWMGSEVTVRDEGDARPEGWMWGGARHVADLPKPEELAAIALRRAQERLGTKKGPTRKGVMIVAPEAAGRLIAALLRPADGGTVQQGRSFWADRLGEKVVSDKLTITDDPLVVRGLASRLYDGEGIARKPMPIVEAGSFANLYLDTYYARKLGKAPTTGSATNRIVQLGTRDLQAVLGGAKEAILVTSWLGGNSDSTTGDFSFGMRGNLVDKGQIGAPVGEMNVTGNLLDLFAGLVEVGSDPWPYSSLRAPTLVFEGVQFSGA